MQGARERSAIGMQNDVRETLLWPVVRHVQTSRRSRRGFHLGLGIAGFQFSFYATKGPQNQVRKFLCLVIIDKQHTQQPHQQHAHDQSASHKTPPPLYTSSSVMNRFSLSMFKLHPLTLFYTRTHTHTHSPACCCCCCS